MRFLRTLLIELKRAVLSYRFAAAVLIMLAGLIAGGFEHIYGFMKGLSSTPPDALRAGMESMCFSWAVGSDAAHFVLPIAAALPCSVLFIDDMTSGFIKGYVSKTGRATYIAVRGIVSLVVPALAVALGMMILYAALYFILSPYCPPGEGGSSVLTGLVGQLKIVAPYAAGASLWSSVGLLLAGATVNGFSAIASPFIIFYLMEIAFTRYFPKASQFAPSMLLSGGELIENPMTLLITSLALSAALIGAFSAVAYSRIRRQI